MDCKMRGKRGQVAIFVIVAIVIVGVLLIFMLRRSPPSTSGEVSNPQGMIERCAGNAVSEAADRMIPRGGFLEPGHYSTYNGTKMVYLCYTPEYFKTCSNEHPMLLAEIKEQIEEYVKPKIEQCFDSLKAEASGRNARVELGEMKLVVSLALDRIFVDLKRETKITEKETTVTLEDYSSDVVNPIYRLASVARDIANGEASSCTFNYLLYMFIYKDVDITKNTLSDYTRLYGIKDKASGKVMNIAIRGCAIPAGIIK